jgi:16S rRNA (cytidine1402-2'-O)-methyltransferase
MSAPPSATGRLVLVATPIGNLGDLSPRAVDTLASADVICCEDTRRTRALLSAFEIPAGRRLVSLHRSNEHARVEQVLAWLEAGLIVAMVSDAGTPGVSDPGSELVAAAWARGVAVTTVPGPSSTVAALVVSGLPTERFCVEGFLPRKGSDRRRRLAALATGSSTIVILEAPTRVAATLRELESVCGVRDVAVVRELTKLHEEVWRGSLHEAAEEFTDREGRGEVRGEVVIVLGGAPPPDPPSEAAVRDAVRMRLERGDGVRDAAAAVAQELGVPRRLAYDVAVSIERTAPPS